MPTHSLLDEIRARGVVRIAVAFSPPPETGHPPEFYRDPETGEPAGVIPELGKVLARDLGVTPDFVDIPWPEHLGALLDGTVDLLLSYTNTPERATKVEFAGRLLPSQALVMLRRESSVRQKDVLNTPETRIGIWHGSSIAEVAKDHFPNAALHEDAEPLHALEAGAVDACVVDAVTRITMEQHPDLRVLRDDTGAPIVLATEYGHPAIRRGDQIFLNWLRNWLDYRRARGTIGYWIDDWWQSWMVE